MVKCLFWAIITKQYSTSGIPGSNIDNPNKDPQASSYLQSHFDNKYLTWWYFLAPPPVDIHRDLAPKVGHTTCLCWRRHLESNPIGPKCSTRGGGYSNWAGYGEPWWKCPPKKPGRWWEGGKNIGNMWKISQARYQGGMTRETWIAATHQPRPKPRNVQDMTMTELSTPVQKATQTERVYVVYYCSKTRLSYSSTSIPKLQTLWPTCLPAFPPTWHAIFFHNNKPTVNPAGKTILKHPIHPIKSS